MAIILALDIGTSKISAMGFDVQSETVLSMVAAENRADIIGLPNKKSEQNPVIIYQQCLELLYQLVDQLRDQLGEIKAIAISGQMHGVLLVNQQVEPLTNFITWCDRRAEYLTEQIDRSAWGVERSGCYLHPGYGGATLAVLAANGKIPIGATALTIADYIAAKLSGIIATEPTHAASWGIMNLKNGDWDRAIVEQLKIPQAVLPKILPSLTLLGQVLPQSKLPPQIAVYSPIGDNQASFIGTCGLDNKSLLLNLGTGGQISLFCREFSVYDELETRPLPNGGYLLVGASLCGGRSYAILKDFFKRTIACFTDQELSDADLYKTMHGLALDADLPLTVETAFAGSRLSPDKCGTISKINVDNFTPENLIKGTMSGMISELKAMLPQASDYEKVMASGNAVRKNSLVQQLISQEFGMKCEVAQNREEAAYGAAMVVAAKIQGKS